MNPVERIRAILTRLTFWRKRTTLESDLAEEMRLHRDMLAERLEQEGMSRHAAEVEARRRFGNATAASEQSFDEWGFAWLESITRDIRYAVRGLSGSRTFALTVVLTLGLGLGLNTVLFTVFNAYALRPIAVRDPHNLFELRWRGKDSNGRHLSWREFQEAAARTDVFSDSIGTTEVYGPLNGSMSLGQLVTGNFFESLGAGAALGRPLTRFDTPSPGTNAVMVISHDTWKRSYGSAPDVIGKKAVLNGHAFEIVGVAHPQFGGLSESPRDFWIPITMFSAVKQGEDLFGPAQPAKILFAGRLRSGISTQEAGLALTPMTNLFAASRKQPLEGMRAELVSLETAMPLSTEVVLALAPVFLSFFLVLAAACANVSNLVLARSLARQRELGIRTSLGASRGRLIRQLLTECFVLAVGSGAVGFAIAHLALDLGLKALFAAAPADFAKMMRVVPLTPDYRVLAALLGTCLVSALIFGLFPAIRTTRTTLTEAMRGEFGRNLDPSRLRGILVAGQVLVSTVLLISAIVFTRNSAKLEETDIGMETRNIVHVDLGARSNPLRAVQVIQAEGYPGVIAVRRPPLFGRISQASVAVQDSADVQLAGFNLVEPGYFQMLNIPVTRGRGFTQAESAAGSAVALISESTAQKLWPGGGDPIGRWIRFPRTQHRLAEEIPGISQVLVVGVVKDVTSGWVFEGPDASCIYLPASAGPTISSLLVRLDPASKRHQDAEQLRERLQREFPDAPISVMPLDGVLAMQILPFRAAGWIGTTLGILALGLTISGMYGVMTYLVAQRKREIGIRMALGATLRSVVGLVLGNSLRLTALAMLAGFVFCWGLGRFAQAVIPFRNALDSGPVDFLLAGSVVLVAAGLAAFVPSRRAAEVDPAATLRAD